MARRGVINVLPDPDSVTSAVSASADAPIGAGSTIRAAARTATKPTPPPTTEGTPPPFHRATDNGYQVVELWLAYGYRSKTLHAHVRRTRPGRVPLMEARDALRAEALFARPDCFFRLRRH